MLVYPVGAGRKPPLARFVAWLRGELSLDQVPEGSSLPGVRL